MNSPASTAAPLKPRNKIIVELLQRIARGPFTDRFEHWPPTRYFSQWRLSQLLLPLMLTCWTTTGHAQVSVSPSPETVSLAVNRETVDSRTSQQIQRIDLARFSFILPAQLRKRETVGIDSAIWRYGDSNLDLLIDLGIYSARPLSLREEPEYREERIRIDRKKATMVFFRSSDPEPSRPYVAAVYFPNINGRGSKLAFYATCASPYQQKIAREIFLSIEFKRAHTPRPSATK